MSRVTGLPRLIVTDLDGTLLSPDRTVSPLNVAACGRAAELGIPVVIATGRPPRWLGVLQALSHAHPLVIASNGAVVYDLAAAAVRSSVPVDPAAALSVASDLRAGIPGASFGIETGARFGCEPSAPPGQSADKDAHVADIAVLLRLHTPVVKLLVFHPELSSDQLATAAAPIVGDRLTLTHASMGESYGLIELAAPGVTKAAALARLCRDLGVRRRQVVAFGDMPNDLPMLQWAGRGFVVANAHPSLHRAGFPVVPGNADSGVGRTILGLLDGQLADHDPITPTGR